MKALRIGDDEKDFPQDLRLEHIISFYEEVEEEVEHIEIEKI